MNLVQLPSCRSSEAGGLRVQIQPALSHARLRPMRSGRPVQAHVSKGTVLPVGGYRSCALRLASIKVAVG